MGALERAWELMAAAERITVLTGAGISTESGIPDYRGPNGLWTTNPGAMRTVDITAYRSEPEARVEAWEERLHHPAWTAEPSAGHLALVALERQGRLHALLTQNIDGLHRSAGSSPDTVLELHGTIHRVRCLSCGDETPMQQQLDRVRAGDPDPACTVCGGILKSATVAFGQSLDPEVLERAIRAATDCDLFLAVGTSLTVTPASSLCGFALRADTPLVIVNADPTPYDDRAAVVLRGSIGEVLPALVVGAL